LHGCRIGAPHIGSRSMKIRAEGRIDTLIESVYERD
jgi:hypothetical protein